MVIKRTFAVIVCILLMFYVVVQCQCHHQSDVYTYYCKNIDFTFRILEKDTCDVLTLGEGDSIYYAAPYNGGYCGIEFFLSIDSNVVYLGPNFPTIYNKVETYYQIKNIPLSLEETDSYAPYENDKYWGFFGGCDQGRYTFGVMRGRKDYGIIEPLEWK